MLLLVLFQAAVSGLQNQPIINAVIDGDDIIYRDYIDISIAVGTPKVRLYSNCFNYAVT
jgi:2-oxoglutarate dehydrogenase E2 component (dihydrolipoamide succinyltransferase)